MEQGRIFKQPYKKTITFRTVFYTALFVFMAFWLGMRIIFPILSNFHMGQFNSIWSIIALISIFLLFFASGFASLSLIICNNYVIVYNDRLVRGVYFHVWNVFARFAEHVKAHFLGKHIFFVAVFKKTNCNFVKKGRRSLYDVKMTEGWRVKASRDKRFFVFHICSFQIIYQSNNISVK